MWELRRLTTVWVPWPVTGIALFFTLTMSVCSYKIIWFSHAVAKWLKHYATNRKVAGWIPDKVIFLNLPNASGRTKPWGLPSL
jgi:hypothetical protein